MQKALELENFRLICRKTWQELLILDSFPEVTIDSDQAGGFQAIEIIA
ncbi:hypothetical protein [Halocella sp. SP3-1]|nr:hypothetical protein [Halocella sp. SP3-1]